MIGGVGDSRIGQHAIDDFKVNKSTLSYVGHTSYIIIQLYIQYTINIQLY